MKKRLIGYITAIMMLLFCVPVQVFAEDVEPDVNNELIDVEPDVELMTEVYKYGELSYIINDNDTITIVGCDANVTIVTIPETIDERRVTEIGDHAFWGRIDLTEVIIPSSVNKIGDYAFELCRGLTYIEIPSSILSIGNSSFANCDKLQTMELPDTVAYIGVAAFANCAGLESIVLPSNINQINAGVFAHCTKLSSITIPSTVTIIDRTAFEECIGLNAIYIPPSVAYIASDAFSKCENLISIDIDPKNINYNSVDGVIYDKNLTQILCCAGGKTGDFVLPETVTTIGDSAFQWCDKLNSITMSEGVTRIGMYAFYGCDSLERVYMPSSVTNIGERAFAFCKNLKEVQLPNNISNISYDMFSNSGLETIYIPDNVTSIDDFAFSSCYNLSSVDMPEHLTVIGYGAFSHCTSLTEIDIPFGVESINNSAFANCDNLKYVTIPSSVTNIGRTPFSGCDSLVKIDVDRANQNYSSYDGILFNKAGTELISYPGGKGSTYDIPSHVTSIGYGAFYGSDNLRSVSMSDNVTNIGVSAFGSCSGLMQVELSDNITVINNSVFSGCDSLRSIVLPDGITHIYYDAFSSCDNLISISLPDGVIYIGDNVFQWCSSLKNISIPDGVSSIGVHTFSNCSSLTNVSIPSSVTEIGYGAFSNCNGLKDVYYNGSEEQWNYISIDAHNECLTSAVIHLNENESTPTPPPENKPSGIIRLLTKYDPTSNKLEFNYSSLSYDIADNINNIDGLDYSEMVGKYVLVETDLWYVTSICVLENDLGIMTEKEDDYIGIDGVNYPIEPTAFYAANEGDRVHYFHRGMELYGVSVIRDDSGVLSSYDPETNSIIIDRTKYTISVASDINVEELPDMIGESVTFFADYSNNIYHIITETVPEIADFNEHIYRADYMSSNKYDLGATVERVYIDNVTPCQELYRAAQECGMDSAATAWSAVMDTLNAVDRPSSLLDYVFEEKDMYKAIIMNMFESSVDYRVMGYVNNKVTEIGLETASTVSNAMKSLYNYDVLNKSNFKNLSEPKRTVLIKQVEDNFRENHVGANVVSKVSKFAKTAIKQASDLQSLCESISMYYNITQLSDSMKEIMQDMYDSCPPDNTALRTALLECIAVVNEGELAFAASMAAYSTFAVGQNVAQFGIDKLWSGVQTAFEMSHPAAAMFKAAYKSGKLITTVMFNSDEIQEKYCQLIAVNEVEAVIHEVYYKIKADYLDSRTFKNAIKFNNMFDVIFNLYKTDCDYALEYTGAIDSSVMGKLSAAMGDETIEDFNRTVNNMRDASCNVYDQVLTSWIYQLETEDVSLFNEYRIILESSGAQAFKTYEVNCPVDVYIYDSQGNLEGSVVDNVPSCVSDGSITIGVDGDSKVIYMNGNEKYTIVYEGNGTGTMDIAVTEFDETGTALRNVYFNQLALNDGTVYTSEETGTIAETGAYVLVSPTDERITPNHDSMQSAEKKYTASVTQGYFYDADFSKQLTAGERVEITAYIPEGCRFEGWSSDCGEEIFNDPHSVMTVMYMPSSDVNITANISKRPHLSIDSTNDGSITVNANECQSITDGNIVLAVYNLDGTLKSVDIKDFADSVTFENVDGGDCLVKAMLWDGLDSMNPLALNGSTYIAGMAELPKATPTPTPTASPTPTPVPADEPSPSPTPTAGIVASGECGDAVNYVLYEDGKLVISGEGEMARYTAANQWNSYKSDVTEIIIEDGITCIAMSAFNGFTELRNVSISNSVAEIEPNAFYNCSSLTSVTIPSSVTDIGVGVFSGCDNLIDINVDSSNPAFSSEDGVLFNKEKTAIESYPAGRKGEYSIPSSVTIIYGRAFEYRDGLTSITIPEGVTSIGVRAFYGCTGLTNISIPGNVTSMSDYAFQGCSNLTTVEIQNGATIIGNAAFADCTLLTSISIPDSVTKISTMAFENCSGLTEINIPGSVTSIGMLAFNKCTGLTGIVIPSGVENIEWEAFSGCSSLTSVMIPASVTRIGARAFAYCSALTDVYYEGSADELQNIMTSSDNETITNANIHYEMGEIKLNDLIGGAPTVSDEYGELTAAVVDVQTNGIEAVYGENFIAAYHGKLLTQDDYITLINGYGELGIADVIDNLVFIVEPHTTVTASPAYQTDEGRESGTMVVILEEKGEATYNGL